MPDTKNTFKILQLDGGGIKGIIFLTFLFEIEKRLSIKICDLFDMFIGTSTGGYRRQLFPVGIVQKKYWICILIRVRIFLINDFWVF